MVRLKEESKVRKICSVTRRYLSCNGLLNSPSKQPLIPSFRVKSQLLVLSTLDLLVLGDLPAHPVPEGNSSCLRVIVALFSSPNSLLPSQEFPLHRQAGFSPLAHFSSQYECDHFCEPTS